ncbi:lipopolysaccharide transport periplasmic protein LptA [Verticiella sediminum]|nr:lipopolysaccharide transport periplasmic protein LptA [Verticiella sediminum]
MSVPHATAASRLTAWLASGVAALCLAALPAHAGESPRLQQDVPTLIDSDQLDYDDTKQTSVFTGNVVLTRGDLSLRAERLELRQNDAGEQFAVATAGAGKQVYVRQTQPDSVELIEGYADRAEWDSRAEQLDFIGRAVVTRMACSQKLDEIRGERISYNQQRNVYSASGGQMSGAPKGRVRTMIQSRTTSDAAVKSCAPTGGKQ